MGLSSPWGLSRVLPKLVASSRAEVLQELAEAAAREIAELKADQLARLLRERELIGTTGKGDGVAIPHAKVQGLGEVELFFGRSIDGIPFEASDGKPVHFFFLLLAPEEAVESYMVWLGRVAGFANRPAIQARLLAATGAQELLAVLSGM